MNTLSSHAVAVVKIYCDSYNVLVYKHPVANTCVPTNFILQCPEERIPCDKEWTVFKLVGLQTFEAEARENNI